MKRLNAVVLSALLLLSLWLPGGMEGAADDALQAIDHVAAGEAALPAEDKAADEAVGSAAPDETPESIEKWIEKTKPTEENPDKEAVLSASADAQGRKAAQTDDLSSGEKETAEEAEMSGAERRALEDAQTGPDDGVTSADASCRGNEKDKSGEGRTLEGERPDKAEETALSSQTTASGEREEEASGPAGEEAGRTGAEAFSEDTGRGSENPAEETALSSQATASGEREEEAPQAPGPAGEEAGEAKAEASSDDTGRGSEKTPEESENIKAMPEETGRMLLPEERPETKRFAQGMTELSAESIQSSEHGETPDERGGEAMPPERPLEIEFSQQKSADTLPPQDAGENAGPAGEMSAGARPAEEAPEKAAEEGAEAFLSEREAKEATEAAPMEDEEVAGLFCPAPKEEAGAEALWPENENQESVSQPGAEQGAETGALPTGEEADAYYSGEETLPRPGIDDLLIDVSMEPIRLERLEGGCSLMGDICLKAEIHNAYPGAVRVRLRAVFEGEALLLYRALGVETEPEPVEAVILSGETKALRLSLLRDPQAVSALDPYVLEASALAFQLLFSCEAVCQ